MAELDTQDIQRLIAVFHRNFVGTDLPTYEKADDVKK